MEHAIEFIRIGCVVKIRIPTDLPSDKDDGSTVNYNFGYECGDVQAAELLLRYLREGHGDLIQKIREAEFMDGWRHAKAKKRGKEWFGRDCFSRLMDKLASCYGVGR